MRRTALSLVTAVFLAACQDTPRTTMPVAGPALDISEGRTGGNPDFFFAAPLAATPQPGDPNFDVGGSNGALRPYLRVCETDFTTDPAGCVVDVTLDVTGSATGLVLTYN